MAEQAGYQYPFSAFPSHKVATDRLGQEIQSCEQIIVGLLRIDTNQSTEICDIWFKAELDDYELDALGLIVSNHSGEPLPDDTVIQAEIHAIESGLKLPVEDKAFPDRTGYNVYYVGNYGIARPGMACHFLTNYSEIMALQGLMIKLDNNVNEGSGEWDPTPKETNTGTGVIVRGTADAYTVHARRYLFSVSNKSGETFDLDWESDADTQGTIEVSGSNCENVLVEEGMRLTLTGLADFADGDEWDLLVDHGDSFTVQLVDVLGYLGTPGEVIKSFAINWPAWDNEEFQCLCADKKDLYPFIFFRVSYTSTYGQSNVKVKFVPLTRTIEV